MTNKEEQRLIHIRIDRNVHKDLRRVAAEYDLTIQDIVSGAVEKTVHRFTETGELREISYSVEIDDNGEAGVSMNNGDAPSPDLVKSLKRIEMKLDKLIAIVSEKPGVENG